LVANVLLPNFDSELLREAGARTDLAQPRRHEQRKTFRRCVLPIL